MKQVADLKTSEFVPTVACARCGERTPDIPRLGCKVCHRSLCERCQAKRRCWAHREEPSVEDYFDGTLLGS